MVSHLIGVERFGGDGAEQNEQVVGGGVRQHLQIVGRILVVRRHHQGHYALRTTKIQSTASLSSPLASRFEVQMFSRLELAQLTGRISKRNDCPLKNIRTNSIGYHYLFFVRHYV